MVTVALFIASAAALLALGLLFLRWRRTESLLFGGQCLALGGAFVAAGAHASVAPSTGALQAAHGLLVAAVVLGLSFAALRRPLAWRERLALHLPGLLFLALLPTPYLLQDFRGGVAGPALPFLGVYAASALGAAGLVLLLQRSAGSLYLGAGQGVLGGLLAVDLLAGSRLAWAPAGGLALAALAGWAQARHGAIVRVEKVPKVEPGQALLLLEERPAAAERVLAKLARGGVPAIAITRESPDGLRARVPARVLWLSSAKGEEAADPADLESLLERVERLLREQPAATLYFDGFEYLVFQRGFPVALRFLAALREAATRGGGRLLVPVHPKTIEEREVAHLSREAGLASWSTLLRPERLRVRSFEPGYLYLVADGGPERSLALLERQMGRSAGLCITRTNPMEVRKRLPRAVVVWLSDAKVAYESVVGPAHLELLLKVVEDFLAQNPGSPVLLDGLEHLVAQRDFNTVLRFLYLLHDLAVTRRAKVVVPVDPRALDERKMALLSREGVWVG